MALIDVIGTLGFLFGFIICVSPAKSVYEGIKNMELKNLTQEYLLTGVIQGSLWSIYGHKIGDFYVYFLNDIVIICFLSYLNAILYINKKNSEMVYYNFGVILFIAALSQILSINIALLLSTIVSTIWQFTTLRNVRQSLSLKDASYINLLLAYVSCAGFSMWTLYSFLSDNYLMFIPNLCGALMWEINIIIFYWTVNQIADDSLIIKLLKKAFIVEEKTNESPLLSTGTPKTTSNDF